MAGSIDQNCPRYHLIIIKLHDLWNPEVQFYIYKSSPIISTLNRINLISHINTISMLILSSNLRLGLLIIVINKYAAY